MTGNSAHRLSLRIAGLYSTPLMIALLAVATGFLWVFNASALPLSNPSLKAISGQYGLLDLMPFYTAEQAATMIGHYGSAGRELYYRFLVADFLFIPIYSLGLALLVVRAVRALPTPGPAWLGLNLLPVGVGLFDVAENLSVLGMLLTYPDTSAILGSVAGIATLCKHALTAATVIALILVGLILLRQHLIRSEQP